MASQTRTAIVVTQTSHAAPYVNWTIPTQDCLSVDDGSYASCSLEEGEVFQDLIASGFGFTIPYGNTITAISGRAGRCKSGDTTTSEECLRRGSELSLPGDEVTWQQGIPPDDPIELVDLIGFTPLWGFTNWTRTQINDESLAIVIHMVAGTVGADVWAGYIELTVEYEEDDMSAETTIKGVIDRSAALSEGIIALAAQGTNFRARIDAAADYTFEDDVIGRPVTALDTKLSRGLLGNVVDWGMLMQMLQSYFANPVAGGQGLGYSATPWASFFAAKGWRVPYWFAEAYFDKFAARIPAQFVFPKGTWAADIGANADAALHKFSHFTLSGSGAGSSAVDAGPIDTNVKGVILIVDSDAGSTATACTVTASAQLAGTKTVTVTPTTNFVADVQNVVGIQAIGGAGAAAGQKVVPVAATGQFTVGDWVLIVDGNLKATDPGAIELCQVASIVTNTSLTMVSNLLFTWTSSHFVIPLYINGVVAGVTGGAENDVLSVYARPDRAIAL